MKLNRQKLDARREALALDLYIDQRTSGGDLHQGFCCSIATSLDCGVPGDKERAEVSPSDQQRFLEARARMLDRLRASGAKWLEGMKKIFDDEASGYGNPAGSGEWSERLDSLGLSREDFLREALVCALVVLSVPPAVASSRAGRVTVPEGGAS